LTPNEILSILFTVSLLVNAVTITVMLKQDSKISKMEFVRQHEQYKPLRNTLDYSE
jgi:hypothetical protein